ncbi:MAG TPA: AAA family ATPase [Ktedonobacterales bacterium]|nr:AAA family ATPase [Ktedonobacterales bacterium]
MGKGMGMDRGMGDERTAQAKEIAGTTETAECETQMTVAGGTTERAAKGSGESTRATTPQHHLPPAVADYLARGWRVAPLRPGEKAPALARWPELRLDEAACARWFGWRAPERGPDVDEYNVGLILGAASSGLVDVDADTPEARAALVYFLPRTGRVSGRPGAPCSHFWYRIKGELPPTTRFEFSDGTGAGAGRRTVLVELRSTGCQTMVAPSRHPNGERVRWEGQGEAARVTAAELLKGVAKVAASALLVRHWPAAGSRDEAAKDLTGMLVRGGWSERETDGFVTIVAGLAGDEEWQRRGGKAAAAARKLAEGGHITGGRSLAGRLRVASSAEGERVVAQVRAWLRLGTASAGEPARGGTPAGLGSAAVQSTQQSAIGAHIAIGAQADHVSPYGEGEPLWGARLADLPEEQLHWLWQGRIPLGALTVLDGDPGLGKSLMTLDLAARVTTGREMPDGTPGLGERAGVVLLTSEDHPTVTIRPRLRVAGADLERVVIEELVRFWDEDKQRWSERAFSLASDVPLLEAAIRRIGARLVVIDPLMAYLGPQVNTWRDQDVRSVLAPLARMAQATGAAVVIVRHLNKSSGVQALYRGGGSIGIIGAARAGLVVAKHPDEPDHERVLAPTKSNLGPPMPSLRYRIVPAQTMAQLEWLGECELSATELLGSSARSAEGNAAPVLSSAVDWLLEELATGERLAEEMERGARARAISHTSLRRARKQLGVVVSRRGYGTSGQWAWRLPTADEHTDATTAATSKMLTPVIGAHADDLSTYGGDERLWSAPAPSHSAGAPDASAQDAGAVRLTAEPDAPMPNPSARRAPALPDVAFPAEGGLASDAVGGPLGMAAPASGATGASDVCPVTGGPHVYAKMRDARGRLVCVECQMPGQRPGA